MDHLQDESLCMCGLVRFLTVGKNWKADLTEEMEHNSSSQRW